VSVRPEWLYRVGAHVNHAQQLEGLGCEWAVGILVKVAHDIPLPSASGAWAVSPKLFKRDKTLGAIIPFDGQFIANLLYVHRLHRLKLTPCSRLRPTTIAGFQQFSFDVEKEIDL
jgi:hypothetical protein